MKISIVIPARNEETNVENMIRLLVKSLKKKLYEIIVVNDCSTDGTGKILRSLAKRIHKLKPINRTKNPGVGNAIRKGLEAVSPKTDHVLMLDCDFVENIDDIKKMVNKVGEADGFLGSRYIKEGILVNYPAIKKIANRSFHTLARLFLGISNVDVTNNFKLYKYEIVKNILPFLKSRGFSINAETGLYPLMLGYKLKEVPVRWIGRTAEMGTSNFKVFKAGPGYIEVLKDAIKFKYFKTRYKNLSLQSSEKRHFDDLVRRTGETYYGNLRPIAKIRFVRKADQVSKQLNGKVMPKVLEIGCGTGILSSYLLKKRRKLKLYGVDISPEAITVAKKNLSSSKNVHFEVGDILNLKYPSHSFDMVIGNSVLHHVPLKSILSEVKRVSKPGAKVWFCEPNILNPQIALEKNLPVLKTLLQDSQNETAYNRWQLKKDMEKAGFEKVEVTPYEFLHPILPEFSLPFLSSVCILLEKVPVIKEFAGTLQITGTTKGVAAK